MRRRFGSIVRRFRPDGTQLPGYYVRWSDASGRRCRRLAGDTRAEAEAALARLAGEVGTARGQALPLSGPAALSLAELAPRIIAVWRLRLEAGTMEGRPRALRRWADRLGLVPVGAITRAQVQAVVNLLAEDLKASSMRSAVAVLSAAFSVLRTDFGLEGENPCHGLILPRCELKARPHLAPADVNRLLDACPEEIRTMVLVLVDAGLRPAELFRLTRGEVSFELKALRLEKTKTHTTRTIPMTSRLLEALRAREGPTPWGARPDRLVFTLSEDAFRWRFRQAARAAGLPDLEPYDLRHAFASALLVEGAAPSVVRDLLGHSSLITTDRYLRSLPGDAPRAAIDALARSRGEGRSGQ